MTRRKPQKVKEIFPVVDGLFTKIDFDFGVTKSLLDVMFVGNYGNKNPSCFVENIQSEYGEELTSSNLELIAASLMALYSDKWEKLKAVPELEYDPIHNYLDEWEDHSDGTESKTNGISSTRQDAKGTTVTTTGTRTDNLLETETINESESGSNSQTDSVYGFNSSTANPSDASSGSNSKSNTGSNSIANTGTQQNSQSVVNSGNDTRTLNETDTLSGSDSRDREGWHRGNIGNLTSQKMIKEEIELWKWNFINQVLTDVCDFCTLPIYLKYREGSYC